MAVEWIKWNSRLQASCFIILFSCALSSCEILACATKKLSLYLCDSFHTGYPVDWNGLLSHLYHLSVPPHASSD